MICNHTDLYFEYFKFILLMPLNLYHFEGTTFIHEAVILQCCTKISDEAVSSFTL